LPPGGAKRPRTRPRRYRSAVVVVGANGKATLTVSGLSAAPHGKTYEAWLIPAGNSPQPAGLFSGGVTTTVRLRAAVPRNAVVAITLERAGGVRAPSMAPILSAQT
jgi:anti-sigma-K factor RskA